MGHCRSAMGRRLCGRSYKNGENGVEMENRGLWLTTSEMESNGLWVGDR